MRYKCAILMTGLVMALQGRARAATFHVSPAGLDTNAGTEALPWRTVQKAATAMQAGDTAVVHAGNYNERITTARGGTAEDNRITFTASGIATVQGFSINHPYITVDGFDITGHSAPSKLTGYIEVKATGDFARILNNDIRDGISLVRQDAVFTRNTPAPNTISTATGGFNAAGFRAGMYMVIAQKERTATVTNAGLMVLVESVTDTVLTLSTAFNPFNKDLKGSEGPVAAYLSGSAVYGLVVNQGAGNVVVRGNLFSNLSFEAAWVGGEGNLYEQNEFRQCNGFNAISYGGENNLFRRNWIHASPSVVYITSPDAMENQSTGTSKDIVFEENFVENFEGPLGVHHLGSLGANANLTFRNNVFVKAGSFATGFPNTSFVNNTFYWVSRDPMPSAGPDLHAIAFMNTTGQFSSQGAVVKNNIFVACGDATKNVNLRGWYNMGSTSNYETHHNFVAAEAPAFSAKTGFNEGNANLNGGDPGFVDINNPLGPDGLPFTDDDGLRLTALSKLRGAGEGGVDLGAYMTTVVLPKLDITLVPNGKARLTWPASADGFSLQTSTDLTSWAPFTGIPATEGLFKVMDVDTATSRAAFFRLAR